MILKKDQKLSSKKKSDKEYTVTIQTGMIKIYNSTLLKSGFNCIWYIISIQNLLIRFGTDFNRIKKFQVIDSSTHMNF